MPQTKAGAAKARKTILEKYGEDYYANIGSKGGKAKVPKGFALMTPEERSAAGKRGGSISKRSKAKSE